MDPINPTSFINVLVTAIPEKNEQGEISYKTTFMPNAIGVRQSDTVINYQLISPTPDDVQFEFMKVSPDHEGQLSRPAISRSGKIITFSDANTINTTLNITFGFIAKDEIRFNVDPEIINVPEPR